MHNKIRAHKKKLKKTAFDFIPQDPTTRTIMQERAAILARKEKAGEDNVNYLSYIICHLGENDLYGIPYLSIVEVLSNTPITQIPRSQNYIVGIINYRGSLIAIIDIKTFLYHEPIHLSNDYFIIVVKHEYTTVGILVNKIIGDDIYHPTMLDPPLLKENELQMHHIVGLAKGKIAILNIEHILKKLTP